MHKSKLRASAIPIFATLKIATIKKNRKNNIRFWITLSFSCIALYFVFTKIDRTALINTLKELKLSYFIWAIVAINIAKLIASFRIWYLYKAVDINLSVKDNLKLYYIGRFFNMFLPTSVGGDAYKTYLLYDQFPEIPTKNIILATVYDRLSGLAVLAGIALFFTYFSTLNLTWLNPKIFIFLAVLTLPVFYLTTKILFKILLPKFSITVFLSSLVQLGDVIAAILLLYALDVHNFIIDYLALFLFSSVAAVLPISISGVGLRELVFIYGYDYLQITQSTAVAFTLCYFSLLLSTSFLGLPFIFSTKIANKESSGILQ